MLDGQVVVVGALHVRLGSLTAVVELPSTFRQSVGHAATRKFAIAINWEIAVDLRLVVCHGRRVTSSAELSHEARTRTSSSHGMLWLTAQHCSLSVSSPDSSVVSPRDYESDLGSLVQIPLVESVFSKTI